MFPCESDVMTFTFTTVAASSTKMCSQQAFDILRRISTHAFAPVVTMEVMLALLVLSSAVPSEAAFYQPPTLASSLGKGVTATCTESNCTASVLGEETCTQTKVCSLKCPTRTDYPAKQNILMEWTPPNITFGCQWAQTVHPGLGQQRNGYLDVNSSSNSGCFLTNMTATTSGRLAISMWINPNCSNCSVVQVDSIVSVLVTNNNICLNATCSGNQISGSWSFIVLQIGYGKASIAVNGNPLNTLNGVQISSVQASVNVVVGAKPGLLQDNSYVLADVRYYSDLLTERELQSLFNGKWPGAGLQSDCRCPPTHLKLKPGNNYTCMNSSNGEVQRLQIENNPPSVLVGASGNYWMGPASGNITMTVHLGMTYQVDSVELSFLNKTPSNIAVDLPVGSRSNLNCTSYNCTFSLPILDPHAVTPSEFKTHVVRTFNLTLMQPGENIIVTGLRVNGRCNCNGNADNCTIMSGGSYQCDCKSGTNTTGNQCETCNSSTFHQNDQFDCQPCDCETAHTANSSNTCNMSTGQCVCKTFVQGRRCNECKDTYHKLQMAEPGGCIPCNCNKVGSISPVCNKTTGQCPCLDGQYTTQNCTPEFTSMIPNYGPLAGMTEVTLLGRLLGNSSQVLSVYIKNNQTVISHNETTIIFKTNKETAVFSADVQVNWQDENSNVTVNTQFHYHPDPVIDMNSLPKVDMFVSGGCGVFFKGSNFASVATPQISVSNSSYSVFSPCRHIASDIRCTLPDLSEMHDPLSSNLHFGLYLDGVINASLGGVTVMGNPVLTEMGETHFEYAFKKSITLGGSGLLGCPKEDIRVLIGVVGCSIQSVTSTSIECKPPAKAPGNSKKSPIIVKIGNNIEKQVGTLVYREFWESNIFIGIMCGIGGLILLVIVIIIFCCCRSHWQKKQSLWQNSNIGLVEKEQTSATQNQYTTLPPGSVNNGFHAEEIKAETVLREPKDALPPTAKEVDLLTKFLNRIEQSLHDGVRASAISSNDLKLGCVCTARGKYARIIDGTFSTVTAGQKTEKKVTIKTLKEPLPVQDLLPAWASVALRECLRLHRHTDDNVLSIIGLALDQQKFHMVYPYMENRTLKDHISDTRKEFSVRQLVEFGMQVAEGLDYLAGKDITHRDLATRNCMVDSSLVVKIMDAAFSWDFYENEYVYDSSRERHMPLRWMAPESLTDGYYDMRSDVWSLGVLLWELLTRGCLPFHEVPDQSVKDYVLEGYVLGQPQNCSDTLYELMRQCWDPKNEHRPHISSVVKTMSDELTGGGVDQEDIYVNLGTVEGFYENQMALGRKTRRAPLPPRTSQI